MKPLAATELESAVFEFMGALKGIVAEAEKFVKENVCDDGFFGFGGRWRDACGKRIGEAIVSSVETAVEKNLNLYECENETDNLLAEITSLVECIEGAKEALK